MATFFELHTRHPYWEAFFNSHASLNQSIKNSRISHLPRLAEAALITLATELDDQAETLLDYATRVGNIKLLYLTLKNQDLSQKDKIDALNIAKKYNQLACRLLIEVHLNQICLSKALHSLISQDSYIVSEKEVQAYLDLGAQFEATSFDDGRPLFLHAVKNQFAAVKVLVERGAQVNSVGPNGLSPLMVALKHQPKAIPLLIKAKAEINAADRDGRTPLMYACEFQPEAAATLLEASADVNAVDADGWTPLMYACKFQPSLVPTLIEAGANVNVAEGSGLTALMLAAKFQPSAIADLIRAGATVNATNGFNWTPLMFGATYNPQVIPDLIAAGANVNARSANGWTPVLLAARHQPAAVELLRGAGATVELDQSLFYHATMLYHFLLGA